MYHAFNSGNAPGLVPRPVHDAGIKLWHPSGVWLATQPNRGVAGSFNQPDTLLNGVQC